MSYMQASSALRHNSQGPSSMEVDAIEKGKSTGKGNGKFKGKPEGHSASSTSNLLNNTKTGASSAVTCHYCGKPGHKSPDCFKKKRGLKGKGKGGKRIHEVSSWGEQDPELEDHDWSWSGLDVMDTSEGNPLGAHAVSPIQVFSVSPDVSNWILIDSGASVSVCPPSWAKAIEIEPLNGIKIQGAIGDSINVYGVRRAQAHADRHTSFPNGLRCRRCHQGSHQRCPASVSQHRGEFHQERLLSSK